MKPAYKKHWFQGRLITMLNFKSAGALGSIMVLASMSHAQVVQNGSFEDVAIGYPYNSSLPSDIPGWTHSGSQGDALLWAIGYADGGGNITTAGQGNQFVTMGGGYGPYGSSAWTTTITGLSAGQTYLVDFMTATEWGQGLEPGGPQTMTVSMTSGSLSGSQSYTSPVGPSGYWKVWVPQVYSFVADSSNADIQFSVDNQQYDMGLDAVSVTQAVPEPQSLGLFGVMGLGFGLLRSRKKS